MSHLSQWPLLCPRAEATAVSERGSWPMSSGTLLPQGLGRAPALPTWHLQPTSQAQLRGCLLPMSAWLLLRLFWPRQPFWALQHRLLLPQRGPRTQRPPGGLDQWPLPCSFFCPANTSSVVGNECPAGHYCPASTSFASQFPCPRGTYQPERGAVRRSDCTPCEPGSFLPIPGATSLEDCQPCPAGWFCSQAGLSSPEAPCEGGWFCPRASVSGHSPGAGKRFPDGPCSAGYYCPPGQTSATPSSFRCPPGFYCPEGSPQPRPCENGTFQPQEAKDSCEPCPAGFYCEASSTGMFCSSEGLSQPSGLCHSAHYCSGGAVSPTPIKHKVVEAPGLSGNDICPPGFFCPRGTGSPVPCLPGFYSSAPGLASGLQCQPCPAGHYCSHPGLSHILEAGTCDAGYICLGGSAVPSPSDGTHGYRCPPGFRCPPGAHSELPCEPGTFSPLPGADTCLPCPGGTYCQKAATVEPTTCPKGHYCPTGTPSPLPCPEGTLNPREGTLSSRACQPCPAGRYCPGEGNGQPEGPCSAGYYCEGGAASPTPWRIPAFPLNGPCPRGHYCPQGTLYPVPCPAGMTRGSPGGLSEGSCRPCPAGSFCPSLGLSSPPGSCVAGSECPSDPSASSPMALLCPQGHFCQPGAAWPALCHPGEYQPSLGSDTCLQCPAGFHCPHPGSRVPTLCPAHAYCPAGTMAIRPCPAGHYCPGGSETNPGAPQACPEHTYLAAEGAQSLAECLPCPARYHCPSPGLSSFEDHPCPPGHWCPGGQGVFLCPPGTFRTEPGASSLEDCELCPAGYYCPGVELSSHANVFAIPCRAGSECPAGTESYQSQPCPAGHYCPAGTHSPRPCPSGTFRNSSQAGAAGDCLPCPASTFSAHPGQKGCLPCGSSAFSPPGASHCTCRGLNRVFQKSDSSCICQAGHESEDKSSSGEDCQPQVAERCSPGDIRLAATRTCVSPQQHDCSSFCRPVGGELSASLGICQCREYVSAEELCDAQCLARAPQLSLAWGPGRKLVLSVKGKAGDSVQREAVSTLGPDQSLQGSARVHLVQCGPHGMLGFVISRGDVLDSFLLGPPVSSPRQQRRHRTTALEYPVPQDPSIHPHIPNPVVCLVEGDVILFQLHILPHNRSFSHYPVYQRQHLFNSNPHWDFGAFRRLAHLVHETHLNFSRFAHQFLDPGTYVFRDNGLPESITVVLVKEKGVACDPGLSPVQPSSPHHLARHGVLRHQLPNLGPDWAVISGVLLAAGLATVLLTGLGLVLRPSLAQACPVQTWRPQWRGLGEPHMPMEYVPLRDSLPFSEDLGPWGSEDGANSSGRAAARGTGKPPPATTLEDISVRTLYDKLEDQSLHVAAQLSKHRDDMLAFYRGACRQLQGLKASGQVGEQPLSARQRDPQLVGEVLLKPRPLPSDEKHQGPSPQQQSGPGRLPQGDAKGTDAESRGRGRRTGAFPGLQRKIRQVEDNLDELNEEFFQLTAQALVLQKDEARPGQLSPREGNRFVVLPRTGPPVWQEHRPDPAEAGGPGRENLGTWALNSDQALTLEARRACLAQRAEDLEWELSLLLQVADGSRPRLGRR
ncbi:uncharacterized protein [Vicugna pacos]|uniref:Tyrosine-protein kinase ephrin type A/B receptor-like domain-containing protein n=1 Tax=Vicugna pacos TaxID=30538 RepID=A0ABM5EFT0_VICPA